MAGIVKIQVGALDEEPSEKLLRIAAQVNENFARLSNTQELSSLDIIEKDTVTVTKLANETTGEKTINHNLGYKPIVFYQSNQTIGPGTIPADTLLSVNDETETSFTPNSLNLVNTVDAKVVLATSVTVSDTDTRFRVITPDNSSRYDEEFDTTFTYWLIRINSTELLTV